MEDWVIHINAYNEKKLLTTVKTEPNKLKKEIKRLNKSFDFDYVVLGHQGVKYEAIKQWLEEHHDFVVSWNADRQTILADGIKYKKKDAIRDLEELFEDEEDEDMKTFPYTPEDLYYGLTFIETY